MSKYLFFVLATLICISCSDNQDELRIISESFLTKYDRSDEIDTPAIWHGEDGQHWLLATAKLTDKILVYDASNGHFIKT